MARLEETSDTEVQVKGKGMATVSKSPSKAKAEVSPEVEEIVESDEPQDDAAEGGEDESEYEIETILDSQKGRFDKGQMGYLVSWKGYGPEHNSWIAESDAGNAQDLIDEYWRVKKLEKKMAKGLNPTKVTATSKGRKSLVGREGSSDVASSSVQKKRGRKPKGKDDDAMDVDEPPKKKAAKASYAAKRITTQPSPSLFDDDVVIGDMSDYMKVASWEHVVSSIDTVERTDEGLDVYFTLKTGERAKERSELCSERFPQKLIKFYESNLRWKASDGPAEP